ncbi:MAG: metal-dependent transcriptional regulator [Anaerolineaceae bacterium]|nr:metal-dependent transcriptional regulator [Anaerolineaceae bacterium]MCY3908289.1 metal-dependent transcriptional regulator [Anaerolineaceae bacterium]
MNPSNTMQEYLAEAWRLAHYQQGDPNVSGAALAEVLQVSAPAVTRMVQRLKKAGYLHPGRGIQLTPAGERVALQNIRRHRLVEVFLVDVMSLGWHEVHDSADELGAVVSDVVLDRMDSLAGYPRRCPHGEPIPTRDGHMPRIRDQALNEVGTGRQLRLSRVHSHDGHMLQYLDSLGLRPGVRLTLVTRAPFSGPLHLRLGERDCFIGPELASVLRVCAEDEFALV